MGVLPKVTLFLLLGAATMHQSEGMISWRPASRSWPLFSGFRHSNALQGPLSHGLDLWNDFDDFMSMWPTHRLVSTHPSRAMQTSTEGGWVKMDEGHDDVQNQFDCEEQQLQLKEYQLKREWQDLKNRREEQKRHQEQEEHLKEKMKLQQQERLKREEQLHQAKMQEQRKLQELERLKREEQFRQAKMQEQRKLQELERLKREEQLRQAKMQQQRNLQEQETQRRQEEMRLREERKQLEEQRQLNKERQGQIRAEEELNRRRAAEEKARKVKRRQQQEDEHQRQMEELRRKRERKSTREETSRHRSRNSNLPKSEIGKLNIPEGYHLEDISIQTIGNQAFVKGHHLCKCYENCYEREFERRLSVPKNVDTRTITASLYPDGQLRLHGVKYRQVIPPIDTDVGVEGVGLTPRMDDDSCSKLSKKKSGFKLKKMNARTGEVFENVAPLEDTYPRYESEVDEDGLTIEVVE